jgi:hypothetical protein
MIGNTQMVFPFGRYKGRRISEVVQTSKGFAYGVFLGNQFMAIGRQRFTDEFGRLYRSYPLV